MGMAARASASRSLARRVEWLSQRPPGGRIENVSVAHVEGEAQSVADVRQARPAIFAMISCAPSVKESRNSAPSGSTVVTVASIEAGASAPRREQGDVLGPDAEYDFRAGHERQALRGSSGSDAPAARTHGSPGRIGA